MRIQFVKKPENTEALFRHLLKLILWQLSLTTIITGKKRELTRKKRVNEKNEKGKKKEKEKARNKRIRKKRAKKKRQKLELK